MSKFILSLFLGCFFVTGTSFGMESESSANSVLKIFKDGEIEGLLEKIKKSFADIDKTQGISNLAEDESAINEDVSSINLKKKELSEKFSKLDRELSSLAFMSGATNYSEKAQQYAKGQMKKVGEEFDAAYEKIKAEEKLLEKEYAKLRILEDARRNAVVHKRGLFVSHCLELFKNKKNLTEPALDKVVAYLVTEVTKGQEKYFGYGSRLDGWGDESIRGILKKLLELKK